MTFLLLEIAGYLIAMFVLGIALGWAIWGRGRRRTYDRRQMDPSASLSAGASKTGDPLAQALAKANHEKSVLVARVKELEKG